MFAFVGILALLAVAVLGFGLFFFLFALFFIDIFVFYFIASVVADFSLN